MKTSRIVLFAALGVIAVTVPAAAAPASFGGGAGAQTSKPALMQVAQNATRAINEARGGNFKATKKKKNKARM